MIPITVVRNGDGPTALLTGGNHGDEYEGPVALQALARDLDPEAIHGRVIIVPFMNYPASAPDADLAASTGATSTAASRAGRTARRPEDRRLLQPHAGADGRFVLDFHSGGRTLDFLPFAAAHRLEASMQEAACIAAMRAFNAPYSMVLLEIDASACSTPRSRRSARSSSRPNSAAAARRRRGRPRNARPG
jgi:N2-acetyl-L-2,4-diaminobutanoate deacetylase